MSARILSLDRIAERRPAPGPVARCGVLDEPAASAPGAARPEQRYAHSVFSLIECPPLPRSPTCWCAATPDGSAQVLHIASGASDAPTLNLARIRQRGAMLGANEVHVHVLARTDDERQLVVCDLRAGQFGALAEEPARAVCA